MKAEEVRKYPTINAEKAKRKSRANPEQVESDFPKDIPDERFTPAEVVVELHRIYRFDTDAFCHAKAPSAEIITAAGGIFWTKRDNSLSKSWRGRRVFAQPPYSNLDECIQKGFDETADGCPLVVFLVPNWTDRDWWHRFVEPYRGRKFPALLPTTPRTPTRLAPRVIDARFLPGRMTFGNPKIPDMKIENKRRKALGLKSVTQAQFGMVLIEMWGRCA